MQLVARKLINCLLKEGRLDRYFTLNEVVLLRRNVVQAFRLAVYVANVLLDGAAVLPQVVHVHVIAARLVEIAVQAPRRGQDVGVAAGSILVVMQRLGGNQSRWRRKVRA